MLQDILDMKFEQLKKAKSMLKNVRFKMDEQEAIKTQREATKSIEALKGSNTIFNVAFSAIDKEVEKMSIENAAEMKLDDLKNKDDISNDSDIQAMLDEAGGTKAPTRTSRLANL